MNSYSKDTLVEYIHHAIDLESSVLAQELIKKDYIEMSQERKPKHREYQAPKKPTYFVYQSSYKGEEFMPLALHIGGILGIITILCGFNASNNPSQENIRSMWMLVLFMCIPWNIGGILKRIHINKKKAKVGECNQRLMNVYDHDIIEYNRLIDKDRIDYKNAMQMWEPSNDAALEIINNHINDIKSSLERYYTRDIIFPKYRNLPALTSIYEYLVSGRCDELTGTNGAYNIYEAEVRQNTVISQLNTIIENLEQIKQNQYTLYGELQKISQETSQISMEMRRISGYTFTLTQLSALNAYYNSVAASAASAMAFEMALR